MKQHPVDMALEELRQGRMIILSDGTQGESQLCMAAEAMTPEAINFMVTHGRGLVCLCLTAERMQALAIPLLTPEGTGAQRAYGASFEARRGVTTGISASDRSITIQAAMADDATPNDIVMPGHIIPIQARVGGALVRAALPEAAVDLTRLAGGKPGAAVCTILNDDGALPSQDDLAAFAELFELPIVDVAEVVAFRLRSESLVRRIAEAPLTTGAGGRVRAVVYENSVDGKQHIALVKGRLRRGEAVLARIHSQCLTGDVLGSERCDCGDQLAAALQRIDDAGKGVLLYMHQEGRGIGLANKIRAYELQDQGLDTVQANIELGFQDDGRDYGIAAQMLRDLGVLKVKLLTNNPKKIEGLTRYGIEVAERQALETPPHQGNIRYLRTKQQKLGHLLSTLKAGHEPA